MTNGFTLDAQQVEKVINNFRQSGRTVYLFGVREVAANFKGEFDSATDCVEMFKSAIWNMGYVW